MRFQYLLKLYGDAASAVSLQTAKTTKRFSLAGVVTNLQGTSILRIEATRGWPF